MRSFLSTITWNFRKNKLNTFIMVMGLSISFSLIIYISGYVHSELSYDSFIKDKNRIYRIYNDGVLKGNPLNIAVTRPSFTVNLKDEIPEIESTVRVQMMGAQVKINESNLDNQRTIRSDENFFTFFDFPLLAQKNDIPLEDPSNVVISETLAKKFFETPEEAIGKNIQIKEGSDYVDYFVGGVFKDIEKNFHLDFQIVLSVQVMKDFDAQTSEFIYTYLKTKNPINDHNAFDLKLTKYQYAHAYDDPDAKDATSFDDFKNEESYLFILSEPLDEIHFSKHKFEAAATSNETYVYGAVVLALLVVIISFINYFNLSIATLSKRFKNFGIRKTLGASKNDIARSFIYESMFIFLLIFFASWIAYSVLKEPFSQFTGFHIRLTSQNLVYLSGITGSLLLILILISNFFSYLVVSRQSSQQLLKKTYKNDINQFTRSRNFFTVMQFTLSSFVIAATLLVNKQIQYFVKADKGFNAENILTFRLDYKHYNDFTPFIEELEKSPLIKGVSTSSLPLGTDPAMNALYFNSISNEHYFHSSQLEVDDGFAEVYGIELVEGRFFDKDQSSDYNEIVINESAAEKYMFEGSPLGNYVLTNGNNDVKYKIIGIAKDFNFRTLHHPIEPLILKRERVLDNFSLKIDNNQIKEVVNLVQSTLEKFSMGENFNYAFLDEKLVDNYYQEAQFRMLMSFISILAIFISCLGLFSIAQLTAIDKTKEIAIRKINGAKVAEILAMFNRVFVQWVAVAFLIALPITWFTMDKWLENFAYKTELSWWIFALAGIIAIGIALLTVSWQSWKAAIRNPVDALRYE